MRSLSQDQGIWWLTGHLSSLSQELGLLGLLYFQIWWKCVGLICRKQDWQNISPLVRWIIPCLRWTYSADLSKPPHVSGVLSSHVSSCPFAECLFFFFFNYSWTMTAVWSSTVPGAWHSCPRCNERGLRGVPSHWGEIICTDSMCIYLIWLQHQVSKTITHSHANAGPAAFYPPRVRSPVLQQ